MRAKSLCAVLVLLLFTACRQDPFPQDGTILTQKPPDPPKYLPPYVLDVTDTMEFAEGTRTEYELKASVPPPGNPVVTISGLPKGALFDSKTLKISWNPDYEAANDPGDPNVVTHSYPLKIQLRSSDDNITVVQRPSTLIVKDTPRKLEIKTLNDGSRILEGQPFEQKIQILSEDFPKGPFEVKGTGLPPGVEIVQSADPTVYVARYTPGYDVAKITDSLYKYFFVGYTVSAPRGQKANIPQQYWIVYDKRQKPKISGPTELVQGTEANFVVRAEDANLEGAPTIMLAADAEFGKVVFNPARLETGVAGRVTPSTMVAVRWDQIPPEKIGTSSTLKIKACVYDLEGGKNNCVGQDVKVTFAGMLHKAPLIDRSHWTLGTIKYLRLNENLTANIAIRDSESFAYTPTVTVMPESLQEEIKWERGRLIITPKRAGMKQFNLVARSPFGVSTSESFFVEVLPSTWSSTLVLGESLNETETAKNQAFFDDSAVVNPELQSLDGRTLALRKLVVISTKVAQNKALLSQIEDAVVNIPNVMIFTPLLSNFTGPLANEIKNLGVKFDGRLLELPAPHPALADLTVDPEASSGLSKAASAVKLGGSLTTESKSPMTLSLGASGSRCSSLIELNSTTKLVGAVKCERRNRGMLIVAGFEFGDLIPPISDVKIAKLWISEAQKP